MGSTGVPPLTPATSHTTTTSSTFSSSKAVLRIWDSVVPSSLDLFRTFDWNGSVNWSKLVFLSTCFFAMAGCGLLTSLLRRKSSKSPEESRRFRRSIRKTYSKTSAGTVTSSDEEDYDSSGSLRHGTDAALSEKDTVARREQSVEGSYALCVLSLLLYC